MNDLYLNYSNGLSNEGYGLFICSLIQGVTQGLSRYTFEVGASRQFGRRRLDNTFEYFLQCTVLNSESFIQNLSHVRLRVDANTNGRNIFVVSIGLGLQHAAFFKHQQHLEQ